MSEKSEQAERLRKRWKEEVLDRYEEVDPNDEFTWTGVAVGFFLGCGMDPDEAWAMMASVEV